MCIRDSLRTHQPDVLIINPSIPGYFTIPHLKEMTGCPDMKIKCQEHYDKVAEYAKSIGDTTFQNCIERLKHCLLYTSRCV